MISVVIAVSHPRRDLDVERSGVEDVMRILAHGQHAAMRVGVGHEMDVRELGDRVTHALVDAAGDIAALDVCDRLVEVCRGHRNRELLEPIAADRRHVGIGAWKPLVNSSAVRHAVFAIATWLPPSITLKSDVEMAKPPASMSSAMWRLYLSSRIDPPSISSSSMLGMLVQLLDQQLAAPVVGAARDRKADAPLPPRGVFAATSGHGQTRAGRGSRRWSSIRSTRRALRCPARGSRCRSSSRRRTACAARRRRSVR